jgi:spore germination protein KC
MTAKYNLRTISAAQIALLLLTARIDLIMTTSLVDFKGKLNPSLLLYLAIAMAGQLLLLLPLFLLRRRNPGENLLDCLERHGLRSLGIVIALAYFFYFVSSSSIFFNRFGYYTVVNQDPGFNIILFCLAAVLVSVFLASRGIEAIARVNAFFFPLMLISLVLILFAPLPRIDISRIMPFAADLPGDLRAIDTFTSRNAALAALCLFTPLVKGKMAAGIGMSALAGFILTGGFLFVCITVFGEYASTLIFPTHVISTLRDDFVLPGWKTVHTAIWLLGTFLQMSFLLAAAAASVQFICKKSTKIKSSLIGAVPVFLIAILLGVNVDAPKNAAFMNLYGIAFYVLLTAVPLIVWLFDIIRGRRTPDGKKKERGKKLAALTLILAFILPLTGCVTHDPIGKYSFVQAMAIDYRDDSYKLVYSVFDPSDASGAVSDYSERLNTILTTNGKTLGHAVSNINLHTPRVVDLSRTRALFLSENVLQNHLGDVMDFFSRDHQLRLSTAVYGYRGNVSEAIENSMHNAVNPAESMRDLSKYGAKHGFLTRTDCLKIITSLYEKNSGFVIPMAEKWEPEITGDELKHGSLKLSGMAVYGNQLFKGYAGDEYAAGLAWVMGRNLRNTTAVEMPGGDKWSLLTLRHSRRIRTEMLNGKLKFTIEVTVNGMLTDAAAALKTELSPDKIREGEQAYAVTVQRSISEALDEIVRNKGADVLNLHRYAARKAPEDRQELTDSWRETLRETDIDVTVKAKISRIGQSDTVI